jgi:hypothetical protein
MATFIKSGYWKKLQFGLKGYLNLDRLIRKTISVNDSFSNIYVLTAEEYESIEVKDPNTLYFIKGSVKPTGL